MITLPKGSSAVTVRLKLLPAMVLLIVVPVPGSVAVIWSDGHTPVLNSTESLLEAGLATATSVRPSPLKSPVAIEAGYIPIVKLSAVPKLPSPLPGSTLTVPFVLAVTRSSLPSPLRSAAATATGLSQAPNDDGPVKAPLPLPRRTLTALSPASVTARSSLPSLLRSATATEGGAKLLGGTP